MNPLEQTKGACVFSALFARVVAFQHAKFPGQTLQGKLAHLIEEARELKDKPSDNSEWADVLILFIGAADLAGHDFASVIRHANAKMDVNETRQWLPPDANGVYHHKKDLSYD